MKKINAWRRPVLLLAASAGCGWLASRMWFREPFWMAAALFAACLSLALVGCGRLIGLCDEADWTPKERRARELEETDERNLAIREKAGVSAWRWSRYMLLALAVFAIMRNDRLYAALMIAAIALQNIFYEINLDRWNRKL